MSLETKEYAKRLVEQMTLEEKISQMRYESPAIERLHIPAYNWWNEALQDVYKRQALSVPADGVCVWRVFCGAHTGAFQIREAASLETGNSAA